MGCGSSKTTVVEPVKPDSLDPNEVVAARGGARGDSAVSKQTTDSGLGLEAGETIGLPGAVPRILPPLRAQSPRPVQESQRPESSAILEELLSQGIIPAQPKVAGSGEAYNITLDDAGRPRRRPPPRLESLKIRKEQEVTRKEDIEEKMRQVEERRKVREDELRTRLRAKSARPRAAAPVGAEVDAEAPPLPSTNKDPHTGSSSGDSVDRRLTYSPELENDSTFQQIADELF
ncbi:stathmin domain-containing protein 1 [Colossoma macropomum]|uniref:stathmin domain-containing protein 1 n=1 Tax=Colossoma macropomum TaxID=42526 RepID=UPI001865566C|nr:stathmin domain-containing protein 1 [Colossoma macropomum]